MPTAKVWVTGLTVEAIAAVVALAVQADKGTKPSAASAPRYLFSWLRNGASGLRARYDFPFLLFTIRGVVSPGPEASTDR